MTRKLVQMYQNRYFEVSDLYSEKERTSFPVTHFTAEIHDFETSDISQLRRYANFTGPRVLHGHESR